MTDLVIRGGTVIDGRGGEADVAIDAGKIAAAGKIALRDDVLQRMAPIIATQRSEHSHRHGAIFLVIIAVIAIIAVGIFIHRREAQLIAEAERAMPGPLKLR